MSSSSASERSARASDSGGDLGDHFQKREKAYLLHVLPYVERPGILRDLLELAIREDYGLFHHIDAFLGQLPEA